MDSKQCPFCAETIKAEAIICRFCNRQVANPDAKTVELLEKLNQAKQPADSRPVSDASSPLPQPREEAAIAVPQQTQVEALDRESTVEPRDTASYPVPDPEGQNDSGLTGTDPLRPNLTSSPSRITSTQGATVASPRVRWQEVVRDSIFLFLMAMGSATGLTVLFTFLLVKRDMATELIVEQLELARILGAWSSFIVTVIAFAIAGAWGRQPKGVRWKRLLIDILCLIILDTIIYMFSLTVNGARDLGLGSYTVIYPFIAIFITTVSYFLRGLIGFRLSLYFAPPHAPIIRNKETIVKKRAVPALTEKQKRIRDVSIVALGFLVTMGSYLAFAARTWEYRLFTNYNANELRSILTNTGCLIWVLITFTLFAVIGGLGRESPNMRWKRVRSAFVWMFVVAVAYLFVTSIVTSDFLSINVPVVSLVIGAGMWILMWLGYQLSLFVSKEPSRNVP